MTRGMSEELVFIECACDCATNCSQGKVGSQARCSLPTSKSSLIKALRHFDRHDPPPQFRLRLFGKTVFEGWT